MTLIPRPGRIPAGASAFLGLFLLAPPAGAGVRLLASDEAHAVVEVVPGPAEVLAEEASGHEYVRLSIPGLGLTDRAGVPELPVGSVRLAVPPNTVPRLRVREATWSERLPGAVRPVPERIGVRDSFGPSQVIEREPREEALYRSATVQPAEPFLLSDVMGIRDLSVVEVVYYGAQAEVFARGYRLLRRAVLEITFEPVTARGARRRSERAVVPHELWQRTYRGTVLNPVQAKAWARGGPADGPSVGDAPWGGGSQWKVEVNDTGLLEIPFSTLSNAGFPAGIPVGQVAVYQREFRLDEVDDPATSAESLFVALPVPVTLRDRNTNGLFDGTDGVILWGRSVRDQWMTSGWEHEDLFDTRNFVFVRIDPAGGARMATRAGTVPSPAADSLVCTPSRIFREENRRYTRYAPDFGPGRQGFETEFYYWNDHRTPTGGSAGWPLTDPFTVTDLLADSTATLVSRVCPLGKTVYHLKTNRVTFSLNGTQVGQHQFYNNSFYNAQGVISPDSVRNVYTVPVGVLHEGTNTFDFNGRSWSGNGTTVNEFNARFLLDWYEVLYRRQLVARGDQLRLDTSCGSAAPQRIRVRGFGGTNVLLFDVSGPSAPVLVSLDPAQLVAGSGGGTDLRFAHDNGSGAGEYVAIRESAIPPVAASRVTAVAPPTLLAGGAGAQYVVVTHDSFESGARSLAAYRAERYSTAVGTLTDVYNVFGNGRVHPDAIKAYAAYAYHRWTTPVVFLCLIGDASEDHRGIGSDAAPDLLPSHSLWADYEGAPEESDQYFAEVTRSGSGTFDDLSDLYVGRLAVNTPEELQWNLDRIFLYESDGIDELWRRRILLLADDALSGDLGGGVGSGYGWRSGELSFCSASAAYADTLQALSIDALLPDLFCWGDISHPCPSDCNKHDLNGSGNCEVELGLDCGIWYDCRRLPYTVDNWLQEYPCQRQAVQAAVIPLLRQRLNDGVFIWNYEGHANKYFLGHEEVWRDDPGNRHDVDFLSNEGKPFIFLGFACHLSEFDREDELTQGDCLSEKMMNVRQLGLEEPGGCVASFASSGFEFLGPNLTFNDYVLRAFYLPDQLEGPQAAGLPDDGDPNAYVFTLGEATTRARLYYQQNPSIVSPQFRQAAQRFVLLGDPALTPDFGTPAIQVTVNGQTVEDPTVDFFATPDDFPGTLQVVITATDGRGVSSMRIVDSGLGDVDPTAYQVVTQQQTADGVPQVRTLTYDFQLRSNDLYTLTFEAVDGEGHAARFVIRTDTRFAFVDGRSAIYPNPFRDRTRLVFRLPSRATGGQLAVYTVSGRKILDRGLAGMAANEQVEVEWDGRDENGLPVANGTYFLRLKLNGTLGSIEETFPVVKMN